MLQLLVVVAKEEVVEAVPLQPAAVPARPLSSYRWASNNRTTQTKIGGSGAAKPVQSSATTPACGPFQGWGLGDQNKLRVVVAKTLLV